MIISLCNRKQWLLQNKTYRSGTQWQAILFEAKNMLKITMVHNPSPSVFNFLSSKLPKILSFFLDIKPINTYFPKGDNGLKRLGCSTGREGIKLELAGAPPEFWFELNPPKAGLGLEANPLSGVEPTSGLLLNPVNNKFYIIENKSTYN